MAEGGANEETFGVGLAILALLTAMMCVRVLRPCTHESHAHTVCCRAQKKRAFKRACEHKVE